MSQNGNYHKPLTSLLRSLFDYFKSWLKSLFVSRWIKIDWEGNPIKCNVSKEELEETLKGTKPVTIIYPPNRFKKTFEAKTWKIFGPKILVNCHKIKVIVG